MNEHNPITIRLDEMVKLWKEKVQPKHTLIRWMLQPEDHRMYEGFCRLESSAHGKLDNLFVFFYTPFINEKNFSHALMQNWLNEYDNPEQQQLIKQSGITTPWNVEPFRKAVRDNNYLVCDSLLPDMIHAYRVWVGQPKASFVLSLLPKQMSSTQQFVKWLQLYMQTPKHAGIQLLLFDHKGGEFWDPVFEEYAGEALTLHHDLRMQEAIRQIATAGAASDPYAFFRKCMFEMGDAASKKNKTALNEWGRKAIESAKKTADKNLLATAYITYSGMLFSFREHTLINELLDTGMRLCKQQVAAGNESMKPLLLQFYTYKGADCQVQKERREALDWFMKAGDEAVAFGLAAQAVSAYYKAWVFANYKNWKDEKLAAATRALQLSDRLTTEEILSSEYPFMAYDYWQLKYLHEDNSLVKTVEAKMIEAYGNTWQTTVEQLKQNYTKKKIREAKAGEVVIEGPEA
jgi:hypothetical protein